MQTRSTCFLVINWGEELQVVVQTTFTVAVKTTQPTHYMYVQSNDRDENKITKFEKHQAEKPASYLELCGNSEFNTQALIENCSRKSFSLQNRKVVILPPGKQS